MEKIKYGPLVYYYGEDDSQGNFFWGGLPPVGYDSDGVPIDENGMQCLSLESPLHPSYTPIEVTYNEFLQYELPSFDSVRKWFDENFLVINDEQLKKLILKWYLRKQDPHTIYQLQLRANSIADLKEKIWPPDAQT